MEVIDKQAAIDILATMQGLCTSKEALVQNSKIWQQIKDLPPVPQEPIRINLNEPIKIKLTDWGKEIYYHQYDRINEHLGKEIHKPEFPKEDENGYTEFQLWRFMELYGRYMGMVSKNVIEPLEIVYEG